MIGCAKISSDAMYMKRFKKDRDGEKVTLQTIAALNKKGLEHSNELLALASSLKTLIKAGKKDE